MEDIDSVVGDQQRAWPARMGGWWCLCVAGV